jgi:hypothetical protein
MMLVLTAFILEQMVSQALFLALFVATFDSLLNNRAVCFSTSVNSVCSSDSENFGLLFLLILVQRYRMYYSYVQNNGQTKFHFQFIQKICTFLSFNPFE